MTHYQTFQHQHFHQGDYIFREGDVGNFAYIIEQGTVEIVTLFEHQKTVLNTLQEGNIFGELALIDGRPRSASAIAATDVVLCVIRQDQLEERIQSADPILQMLLLMITRYFRTETQHFRPGQTTNINLKPITMAEDRLQEAINIIRLESDLQNALNEQQFRVVFQPIVSLSTQELMGFEALLRWNSPKHGLVSPLVFIPIIESTSLIIPLGEWVIKESITALAVLQREINRELFMSINITSRQTQDPNLLTFLMDCLSREGLKNHQVKLEIIERCLFDDQLVGNWVQQCHHLGFTLSLDDFGTGYSSLSYIHQYRPKTLKIDKSLIDNIAFMRDSYQICRAIIEMSQALEMTTVAEGIEYQEQADLLQSMGCTFGQGYFFAHPLLLEEALNYCTRQNQRR